MVMINPINQFKQWYSEALQSEPMADAMALATATQQGYPTLRMVLLKGVDDNGFVFYTNLNSIKGSQLKENPRVACCFYWNSLQKQVRIEGTVTPVSEQQADDYFHSRAREGQLGAWASKQSQPLPSLEHLKSDFKNAQERFANTDIPRPEYWSGYCIKPLTIEFWIEGAHRLHQREVYHFVAGQWEYGGLLYP